MDRTTSVMTAVILGAALAASTVRAQQPNPPSGEPLGQSVSSDRAEGGSLVRKLPDDPLYGMSVTRGSRYLLRNGLDYLNYKEYERALRFLREAECRKAELNNAEKLVLKKGIESAQRGFAPSCRCRISVCPERTITQSQRLQPGQARSLALCQQARPFLDAR